MGVIYEPAGRAGEYSHLAVNLYVGCNHSCVYCYGENVMGNPDFHRVQAVRNGVIEKLVKEAPDYAGTNKRVLLCFACDPYQLLDESEKVTRAAIEILRANDVPFQVLTKGGSRAARDFDLYGPYDAFGTTLTLLDNDNSREFEPGAALPVDKFAAIKMAKEKGIETFVSLEPMLDAEQSLGIIRQTHEFVDQFRIGTLNHVSHEKLGLKKPDYRKFGKKAIQLCREFKKDYYIKKDLAAYLDGIPFTNTDRRKVERKD